MVRYSRESLLFFYPEPGDGSKCWRPSWTQIMTKSLPSHQISLWDEYKHGSEVLSNHSLGDSFWGYVIHSGYVRGLSDASYNGMPRRGELVVKHKYGSTHTFKIVADHMYPIPEESYSLLGYIDRNNFKGSSPNIHLHFWVIWRRDANPKKVSVFRMPDDRERREIWNLGLGMSQDVWLS
ncbi:hypothetical protein F5146DRAFT_1059095 [Armillaria mellea]|nr:hypothetical protein F5146DRAFT_1059095 [Armillaria mellea]